MKIDKSQRQTPFLISIIKDLRVPPANRIEKLKDDRTGQHSIRINEQWRICFIWRNNDAFDVEIVDYHKV